MMRFNLSKCHILEWEGDQEDVIGTIGWLGKQEESHYEKGLRTLKQNTLSFNRHIEETFTAIYVLLATIWIALRFVNGDIFKKIYTA